MQINHLDAELQRLHSMKEKSTERSLVSPGGSKLHALHALPRADRSGVFRNAGTAEAIFQEKAIKKAIKERRRREHATSPQMHDRRSICIYVYICRYIYVYI